MISPSIPRRAALALALSTPACATAAPPGPPDVTIAAEAGFVAVPPRDVTLAGQPVHLAAEARIFYNLRPADEGAADKPIFVLFNGFAAEIVRAYGTGPATVVEGGTVVHNPSSLTKIANLLYVDPRQAGFSYDVLPGGAPATGDCGDGVFNEYVDAADVALAVLSFLARHPALRGPVYWVAESYAGVRVQWILAYLRGRWGLAPYEDPALAAAIAKADRAASLHAGQILLEGWLAGGAHAAAIAAACSAPAVVAALGASVGAPCAVANACTCADEDQRSLYNYTYATTRQNERELEAAEAHVDPDRAAALFGVDLATVAELRAPERGLGFKCSAADATTPDEGALVKLLGALPAGQSYFLTYSPLQPGKEEAPTKRDWETENYEATAFADNLRDVPAFLTNGERDLVVPERALAPALSAVLGAARVHDEGAQVRVTYPDGERSVDISTYPDAGHMITMVSPESFAHDVTAWVAAHP